MATPFRKSRNHNRWNELRDECRMSIQEISDTIGVCNRDQLSKIFIGRRKAKPEELKALCEFFDISLETGKEINDEVYKSYNPGGHEEKRHTVNAKFMTPLTKLRLEKGLKLREVAHYCGVEEATMSRILNGRQECKPVIKEKLMKLFDLGYAQICDLCHRTYSCHASGDLRIRSAVYADGKEEDMNSYYVDDALAETLAAKYSNVPNTDEAPEDHKVDDMPDIDYSKPVYAPENAKYRKWANRNDISIEEKPVINEPNIVKQALIDELLDVAYGKVPRKDFVDLERVLNQYWMV